MYSLTGQVSRTHECAWDWLGRHTALCQSARHALATLAPRLLTALEHSTATAFGIAGPPGSGKSTLARLLTHLLCQFGRPTVLLSLDDYYLGRAEREGLALSTHELLRQRGVPGTHDWQRLLHDFDSLAAGRITGLQLPVFDKSADDRAPQSQWRTIDFTPTCLVIEGWCVGAPAEPEASLDQPVNELERRRDADGTWRRYANQQLSRYRSDLQSRVGELWYLSVPGWDWVVDWRWQQEQELENPALRSKAEVGDFLSRFERIVRHMQATSGTWAHRRLQVDRSHRLEFAR